MSSTSFIASTFSSSAPSQTTTTTSSNTNNSNNPGSFYKNLFYILIGLLAAFGLVSFLSLMRARRRRHAIVREAERLGVIVPGVPGYIPLRDRRHMNWMKADGSNHPDWWEIEKANRPEQEQVQEGDQLLREGLGSDSAIVDDQNQNQGQGTTDEFHPLAIIPPKSTEPTLQPIPFSSLPFFPNHLAYRPESLTPPPSKFLDCSSDPKILNELVNDRIEIVTIIKMPSATPTSDPPPRRPDEDEDDPESIIREWNGIELGITSATVSSSRVGWNG
ncbi:hypothetical protein I203_101138 [Kwoniella mangroviensis CBS 8507]|uniref:uncharacterized protein n=1 Tax=Kwoniella mangroviensis CBS 8507 TaxID=1296122 RepID=UPI00080D6FBF|nr:uncharacterized protein I203_02772 [Kwoniella mangroviensis CBS 8507]OCF68112.1 hypothetical protein I203_02772 [Kwoniella mangroviensis CBS 8507]